MARLTRSLAALAASNLTALAVMAAGATALSGCEAIQPGAKSLHAAYCNGVSAGGRAALATFATGQPDPVIRCDDAAPPVQIAPELRGPAEPDAVPF